ncbi:prepilin-type N-terminal cleavage/methylation domain-containing protein [Bacillus massiliigorillae]|uniref:prepilin-type N-terminal cleavage/methylation domain-containing protein n=1 Tax=Bacillus massiliigorillae TaxID=1243664 RepID=UPI0003A465F8|nr:prepilin-type N-terminal cleavage/methylation domain-containing protein [Bacillus massiliigorillae]
MKKLKSIMRSQKGMTLIELLAVVVILAILALIAIPSIGGLIDNTKKDAHVANAHQMVSSARLAIATEPELATGDKVLSLKYLEEGNYIENAEDPDKDGGYLAGSLASPKSGSYVTIKDGKVISVKLVNKTRGVQKDNGDPVEIKDLKRDAVTKTTTP